MLLRYHIFTIEILFNQSILFFKISKFLTLKICTYYITIRRRIPNSILLQFYYYIINLLRNLISNIYLVIKSNHFLLLNINFTQNDLKSLKNNIFLLIMNQVFNFISN